MKYHFLSKEILLQAGKTLFLKHNTIFSIHDEGALDSALARALNRYEYDENASVYDLASEYAFGIIKDHPFADGNKRLSFLACRLFLLLNECDINSELSEDTKYDMMIDLASSNLSIKNFSKLISAVQVASFDGNYMSKLQYDILENQYDWARFVTWRSKKIARMLMFHSFDCDEKTRDAYIKKEFCMVGFIKAIHYLFEDHKITAILDVVDLRSNFNEIFPFKVEQDLIEKYDFVLGKPFLFYGIKTANKKVIIYGHIHDIDRYIFEKMEQIQFI